MIRFNKKDVALVAFATGLLAFEAVALQETVPAVKQSLARLAELGPARIASRIVSPAGTAGASVLEGAGQIAEAAVGAAQATVQATSRPALPALKPAAARRAPEARARTESHCMVMAESGADAAEQAVHVVAVETGGCGAKSRAIVVRRNVEAIRRAVSEHRRDQTIHRAVEINVDTDVQAEVSVDGEASSR